jgi:hypothetical protein
MKSINARTILNLAFCFCLFFVVGFATAAFAADYYTYRDPDGKLVISNKPPPPGSKIINKQDLIESTDIQTPGQEPVDTKANGGTTESFRPSKEK